MNYEIIADHNQLERASAAAVLRAIMQDPLLTAVENEDGNIIVVKFATYEDREDFFKQQTEKQNIL